jgi:hypothetical protein
MKNFKFEEPFSSFSLSSKYKMTTSIKERWRIALHDPVYLLCIGIVLILLTAVLTSCQPKNCPAYAKNNTEYGKTG